MQAYVMFKRIVQEQAMHAVQTLRCQHHINAVARQDHVIIHQIVMVQIMHARQIIIGLAKKVILLADYAWDVSEHQRLVNS